MSPSQSRVEEGEARSAPDASLGSGGVALTVLPDDLVNTNAYLLWVDSGRPDGTEFLRASRDLLEADLRSGRSLPELEEAVFRRRAELLAMEQVNMAEAAGEAELPVELINTNAYLMWVDKGRPEGADLGQASREQLVDELRSGRPLAQLEKEVFGRKAAIDALARGEDVDASVLPDLPDGLVNTNAYLMWVDNGRPMGADFGRASRRQLMDELKRGRGLRDLEASIRTRKAELEASEPQESCTSEPDFALLELSDDLVQTNAYLMWLDRGHPAGVNFEEASRRQLANKLRSGRPLHELEEEVYARHEAELEALERGKMLGRRKPPPRLPDIPDALVNTNAYLMWVDSGRPEGADFGRASRDKLTEDLRSGRLLHELEESIFARRAELEALEQVKRGERAAGAALPVVLPDGLVNTNAYLMWADNGRPEGADFGRASRDQLMKELNSGRSLHELEETVSRRKAELEALEQVMRKRQADAAAEPPAPPQELSEELVNANALLMWVDNGRPEGAEFGRASRDLLEAELKSGRPLHELEQEVFARHRAAMDALEQLRKEREEERELSDLSDELVNTNAYLMWVDNGRPEGADFGRASRVLLEEQLKGDRTLKELEQEVYGRKAELEALKHEPVAPEPELPDDLVNTNAYLMWLDHGKPMGADFGQASRSKLIEELKRGRLLEELKEDVFGRKSKIDALEERKREKWDEPDEAEPPGELYDDLVNTNAYLMWLDNGRPMGADFGRASRAELKEQLMSGRTLQDLEEEVFGRKAELDAQEGKPAAIPPELPDDLVNTNAYLMWLDNGRPMGADFGEVSRGLLMEKLKSGRPLVELEAEVFGRKAALEAREDRERGKAESRWQQVDLGTSLQQFVSRPALDLIHPDAPEMTVPNLKMSSLNARLALARSSDSVTFSRMYVNTPGPGSRLLAMVRTANGGVFHCDILTDAEEDLVLHWGVSHGTERRDWTRPEEDLIPDGSSLPPGGASVETAFGEGPGTEGAALQRVTLDLGKALKQSPPITALQFVVRSDDASRWWKDGADNFVLPLPLPGEEEDPLAMEFAGNDVGLDIVRAEGSAMWTLMHRYNKAASILDGLVAGQYGPDLDVASAAAHVFVWLRFSANRQLTWQRNYNTQPRVLSEAQERLIRSILDAYQATGQEAREWVRMMLVTLGRGGDGQRIRDEILNIMHRNGIKEVKGSWMEEWHQKLHNNTTPDDVVICEAYLAFLRSGGDNAAYWRVLNDNGITRERLEGYDRPITAEPEDLRWMRGALIGEFEHYLGVLKAVHGGTDLHTCAKHAESCTPDSARGWLGYVLHNLHGPVFPLIEAAVEARAELASRLRFNRDLLYLDLALESAIRWKAEQAAGIHPQGAIQMVAPLLQNLALTRGDNKELCYCLAAWNALPHALRTGQYPSKEEALQGAAVVDRIRNSLGRISDAISNRVEPIAIQLGRALAVEDWAIRLFHEEVVRGGPAFCLSQVLVPVERMLREAGELGTWQIIGPGAVSGTVVVEPELYAIQHNIYQQPTVLVVDRVGGEEEIPDGVVAVLTPDAPDVLSHVSVRARNMRCVFATCYDASVLEELKKEEGRVLEVSTTAAGKVRWLSESAASQNHAASLEAAATERPGDPLEGVSLCSTAWCGQWCVGAEGGPSTGAKSQSIATLRAAVPEWAKVPASVTVPFGAFEQSLEDPGALEVKRELAENLKLLERNPAKILRRCQKIVKRMTVPQQLKDALAQEMAKAGLPVPSTGEGWGRAMSALKAVWASKFNERAYLSMKKAGLPFMDVRMAVLVMQVVPADYAFVIHTVNPATNDAEEVYCELVKGMGETLVGGRCPGKAMAFSARKDAIGRPAVLSYPSKSEAMVVDESLIFRSDSNCEDLAGFAGAGLYDSVTTKEYQTRRVDYTIDRLVTDPEFRQDLLGRICKVGAAIEESMGCPQDIEGVVDHSGTIWIVQARPQV